MLYKNILAQFMLGNKLCGCKTLIFLFMSIYNCRTCQKSYQSALLNLCLDLSGNVKCNVPPELVKNLTKMFC